MPPEGDSRWEQVFGVSGDGYHHTCSPGGGCDPQLNFCGNILVIRSESDFYPELFHLRLLFAFSPPLSSYSSSSSLYLLLIFSRFQGETGIHPPPPGTEGPGLSNSAGSPVTVLHPDSFSKAERPSPSGSAPRGLGKTAAPSHSLLDREGALGVGGWVPFLSGPLLWGSGET